MLRCLHGRTTTYRVLFICYILSVMMITFLPTPAPPEPRLSLSLLPFEDIGRLREGGGALNAIGNVLLFMPLGLFLSRRSFVHVLLLGCFASLCIEVTQLGLTLFAGADRTISVDDVILNTSGTALGFATAFVVRLVGRTEERPNRTNSDL
jgi:glycopeptide antibiotics resistance protein